jgi:all-trans-8'-apo-beta-carotenal 15,15'-oxygenase
MVTTSQIECEDNSASLDQRQLDWQGGHRSLPQEYSYWIDEIEGNLPHALQGTLFRNGPGLLEVNGASLHHPFDGDGMICAITFSEGKVHFRNRYVRTEGYLAEQQAGKILYRGVFGTQKPGGWLANCFDLRLKNIANTNVIYWAGKLLALWEAGLPHRLNPHTLETLGPDSLDGVLGTKTPFSAHPRFDPGNKNHPPRLVSFSVEAGLSTALTLYEFDLDGQLCHRQVHHMPGLGFFHDFALTPNYAIFFQNPVVLDPIPYVFGLKSAGQALRFRQDQPTRIWIIPRRGEGPVQTLETQPCFIFHHANAWEEGQTLQVESICYPHLPSLGPEDDFRTIDFNQFPAGQLWRYGLDLEQKTVTETCLLSRSSEFPTLHPQWVGQRHRYLYLNVTDQPTGNAPLQAIQKLDLAGDGASFWSAAPQGFVGEPVFVPYPDGTQEDAGWVLMMVYDAAHGRSNVVILEAQNIAAGPVCRLHLKHHVPYGLHGCFSPEVCTVDGSLA